MRSGDPARRYHLIALAPGDPVAVLLGEYPAPPEYVARLREQFGLDLPLLVRLGRYVATSCGVTAGVALGVAAARRPIWGGTSSCRR